MEPATATDNQEIVGSLRSSKEIAQLFQVSEWTLWKLRKEGKLRAVKVGGQIRFRDQDVRRFLSENEV